MKKLAILWTATMSLLLAVDGAANAQTGTLLTTATGSLTCYGEQVGSDSPPLNWPDNMVAPAGTSHTHYSDCTVHYRKGPNYTVSPANGLWAVVGGDFSIPSAGLTCSLGFVNATNGTMQWMDPNDDEYFDGRVWGGHVAWYLGSYIGEPSSDHGTCRYAGDPNTYTIEGVYMMKGPFAASGNLQAPQHGDIEDMLAVVVSFPGTFVKLRYYFDGWTQ